jgi:hypothetical protein
MLIIGLLLVMLGLPSLPAGAADPDGGQTAPVKIPFPKPQSHKGNWIEYHGRSADVSMIDTGNTCLVCHEKADCISCHNTKAPRDHTNTWRTLSHGFMAEGNRERCLTCHKQDFCVRCHHETAPRSHTGSWSIRHCTWCHYGSGLAPSDNCVVCHKLAAHTSAPHNISPALNCGLCHTQ